MRNAAIAVVACLSVCLSVTRRYCIESVKDIIKLFLGLVWFSLWFSYTTCGCEILTGRGACHSGGLFGCFRSENA